MQRQYFSMELHNFYIDREPCIASLTLEEDQAGCDEECFSVTDISYAFDPGTSPEPIEGAAFDIKFSLPDGFNGSEPTFQTFRAYGLEPRKVAELCRRLRTGEEEVHS